jgi:HTH-type transcriptional regulator, competence development regulator
VRKLRGLKAIRESKGLSVRQLADLAGMGSSSVSQIENGRRKAQESTINKLSKVLGVQPLDLVRPTSWDQMDEDERAEESWLEEEAYRKLVWLSDELLHLHALKVLDQERIRGMKPASIEELEDIERDGRAPRIVKR